MQVQEKLHACVGKAIRILLRIFLHKYYKPIRVTLYNMVPLVNDS